MDCGCAIPDEAFQGLEDNNDLDSAAESHRRGKEEGENEK